MTHQDAVLAFVNVLISLFPQRILTTVLKMGLSFTAIVKGPKFMLVGRFVESKMDEAKEAFANSWRRPEYYN